MRIDIIECDHDLFDIEEAVAATYGAELRIHQARTPEEIIANCAGADAVIAQYAQIDGAIMDRLPGLKAIGRYGVGVDTLDVPAATERGIAVCSVPDYGTEAVSDHAIAMALAAIREIPRADRLVRSGEPTFPAIRPVHLIQNQVFGVIGMGLIGSAVARKAAGLGFTVIGHDIRPVTPPPRVTMMERDEVLSRANVISMHTPLDSGSRHLLNAETISKMRPGMVVINTSRGGTVDTPALISALEDGTIRAAALDVVEDEPIAADHPLTAYPSVTLTPHVAWYSEESYAELKRRVVENVAEVCAGRTPRNILNPEVLPG